VSDSSSLDAAAVVSTGRTAKNAVSNYAYYAAQAVVLLALQAYVIRTLGEEHYSVWPVLRSCINIAGLIQIGLGAGAARFIAVAIGHRDEVKIQKLVGTYLLATLTGSLLFMSVSAVVAWKLEYLFNVPDEYVIGARWSLIVMGLSAAAQMVGSVFAGVLTASQSFVRLNVLRSSLLLVRVGIVLFSFAVIGPGLVSIAVSHLVVSVAEAVGGVLLARQVLPWLKVTCRGAGWDTFREINSFSMLTLVAAVAAKLYWDTDNVLINRTLDPTMVAGYSIVSFHDRLIGEQCGSCTAGCAVRTRAVQKDCMRDL
jgi:O-antigen/teichoic acid export membrane protein